MRHLPYADNSVDEVHAIHLIEHFNRLEVDDILREWHRVLKPGGELALECPCLNKIAYWLTTKQEMSVDEWRRLTLLGLYGEYWHKEQASMLHQWCYSKAELYEVVTDIGFTDVQVVEPLYHYPARDMRVTARKRPATEQ